MKSSLFLGTLFDLQYWCQLFIKLQTISTENNAHIGAKKFNSDISGWNTSSVTDMKWMFYETTIFNGAYLKNWDVSKVTDMHEMFWECCNGGASLDLSLWDTSSVTTMKYMFYGVPEFNSDISGWDVSNVEDFQEMFYEAYAFNQDLSQWNISPGKL